MSKSSFRRETFFLSVQTKETYINTFMHTYMYTMHIYASVHAHMHPYTYAYCTYVTITQLPCFLFIPANRSIMSLFEMGMNKCLSP